VARAGAQPLLKIFGPPGKIHSIKISVPPRTKTADYTSEVNNKYLATVVDKLERENPYLVFTASTKNKYHISNPTY
jgi:hypothetical protein